MLTKTCTVFRQGKPELQCNRYLVVATQTHRIVAYMQVLHVAPSGMTGANLREAMSIVGLRQEVLPFRDDLSCGPIAWGTAQERTAWWSPPDEPRLRQEFEAFWHRLET